MFEIIKRLTLKVKIKLNIGINLSNYYQAALKDSSTSICLPRAVCRCHSSTAQEHSENLKVIVVL